MRKTLFALMAAVALTIPMGAASGTSDTTPPELTALSLIPASVDITASAQTVTIDATITDDLSGVASSQIQFTSPSGNQYQTGFFAAAGGDH